MIESEESEDPYDNRFFWCFFKLSNGKIIDLQLVENLKNKIKNYLSTIILVLV